MGKRVSINLADIIDNEFVKVSTHMEILPADDQSSRMCCAKAHVYYKISEDSEPCFVFDIEVFQGKITLSMDFNTWSDAYMAKSEFLGLFGVPYTVI